MTVRRSQDRAQNGASNEKIRCKVLEQNTTASKVNQRAYRATFSPPALALARRHFSGLSAYLQSWAYQCAGTAHNSEADVLEKNNEHCREGRIYVAGCHWIRIARTLRHSSLQSVSNFLCHRCCGCTNCISRQYLVC